MKGNAPISAQPAPAAAAATRETAAADHPGRALLRRAGWGHRGYSGSRALAIFVCVILALAFINDMITSLRFGFQGVYVDFRIFHSIAKEVARDPSGPIYFTRPSYLYPPLFSVLFQPLLQLPDPIAMAAFQALKWVALLTALRLSWRLPAALDERLPPVVVLGSLALVWRYFINEMLNGNINMFILAGVLLSAALAQRGRHFPGGLLAGLLTAVKVTPALIIVFFLARGWWRSLPGAIVGLFLGLLVIPAAFFGWETNGRLLHEWHQHIIERYLSSGFVYSVGSNQGISAWLNRLFGDAVAIEPDVRITLVRLPDAVRGMIRWVLFGGVVAVLAWAAPSRKRTASDRLVFSAQLSLMLIGMLVLSGYTWKAHYVAMILPYSVILAYLADARRPAAGRAWISVFLGGSVFSMMLSSDFAGPGTADMLLSYGVVLFSAILAGASLVLILRTVWAAQCTAGVNSRGVLSGTAEQVY